MKEKRTKENEDKEDKREKRREIGREKRTKKKRQGRLQVNTHTTPIPPHGMVVPVLQKRHTTKSFFVFRSPLPSTPYLHPMLQSVLSHVCCCPVVLCLLSVCLFQMSPSLSHSLLCCFSLTSLLVRRQRISVRLYLYCLAVDRIKTLFCFSFFFSFTLSPSLPPSLSMLPLIAIVLPFWKYRWHKEEGKKTTHKKREWTDTTRGISKPSFFLSAAHKKQGLGHDNVSF
ncbi:MAG: hypothetical protein JOS17DRAFT_284202 [Linnemannia elongata]|nr:MAG: hypothetical protein JOS17DRAFT_284202 [Linnemannia elongata]